MRSYYFDEDAFNFGRHHEQYNWHGGRRAGRGDIAPIILRVLEEKPMHGYEIIRKLEESSHGMWRPSAGSVYPTLQLLEEQDLVTSKEDGGKKVYTLTEKGKVEAQQSTRQHPWEHKAKAGMFFMQMRGSIREIIMLVKEIAFTGKESELKELESILHDTLDRLKKIIHAR